MINGANTRTIQRPLGWTMAGTRPCGETRRVNSTTISANYTYSALVDDSDAPRATQPRTADTWHGRRAWEPSVRTPRTANTWH
jgi:hypothetical protein